MVRVLEWNNLSTSYKRNSSSDFPHYIKIAWVSETQNTCKNQQDRTPKLRSRYLCLYLHRSHQGKARTQSPTTTNYAVEFPTFGEIAGVSTSGVQWISLALGKPPSWSWYLPCQVSMSCKDCLGRHPRTQHTTALWSIIASSFGLRLETEGLFI